MPPLVESAFTVRNPAWWDLTGDHDKDRNPKSIEEALQWSGAEWEPVRTPVFHGKVSASCESKGGCGGLAVARVDERFFACAKHANQARAKKHHVAPLPIKQLPDYYAVTRSDTGDVLNVANSTYEIFTNRETAELVVMLLDPESLAADLERRQKEADEGREILEEAATVAGLNVQFETGGVLKGGRLVWFLARLDEALEVPGDTSPIYPYVSVLNSHDGSAALRAINTSIRIVCWNTWSAAENQAAKTGRQYSFRHTGSIRDRVDAARDVLLSGRTEAQEWVEYATRAIAVPVDEHKTDEFLELFIPMPPAGSTSERVQDNVRQARGAVKKYLHSPSCASIAGTAWGLISAVGEYLDHGRDYRTQESYVSRTMLAPEKGKLKAMKLMEELVGVI